MPLHFTLLFIDGTPGWDQHLKQINEKDRITPRQFVVYHLKVRKTGSDFLLLAGRLFQEWILNAWVTCENQKLNWMRLNQKTLRAETFKNIQEAVAEQQQERADSRFNYEQENREGRFILAITFQCSPRWYNRSIL